MTRTFGDVVKEVAGEPGWHPKGRLCDRLPARPEFWRPCNNGSIDGGVAVSTVSETMGFLNKAMEVLCQSRRTLMFTYILAYFLEKSNQVMFFLS